MKKAIITGASSGLGLEVAKKVANNKDYKVVLACRNAEKGAKTKEEIINETGNPNIEVKIIDTSSLKSVRSFVDEIAKDNEKIDVLVNNAGISGRRANGLTDEGFEIIFATNYLGHFLLTNLLIPHMNDGAKIFNVSSDMHNPPGGVSWVGIENIAHPKKDDSKKYAYSKLCMIYFTHSLYKKFKSENKNIMVNSFNPGYMSTTNFASGGKAAELFVKTTMPDRMGNLDDSSTTLSNLILDENFNYTNEYFDRSNGVAKSSDLSYNENNEKELWDASVKYCNL